MIDTASKELIKQLTVNSSYSKNNLGQTIYDAVITMQPKTVLEFGCYEGYSTICIALALKDLGRGHLTAHDLWDEYPYRHTSISTTRANLARYEVEDRVTLKKMSFYDWLDEPADFDLLHLDISNDGFVLETAYEALREQIDAGATVLFEGGSHERDQEPWMTEYSKKPFREMEVPFLVINSDWPSLSIIVGDE